MYLMSSQSKPSQAIAQRGAGLIEVLVAALVLGVGLLGILSLQGKALQFSQQSYTFSQASVMVNEISEKILANPNGSYVYKTTDSPSFGDNCTSGKCDSTKLAAWDLANWNQNILDNLPGGEGEIVSKGSGASAYYVVSVRYRSERGEDASKLDELKLVVSP